MDEMAAEPLCLSAPLQVGVDQRVTAVAGQEARLTVLMPENAEAHKLQSLLLHLNAGLGDFFPECFRVLQCVWVTIKNCGLAVCHLSVTP